MFINQRVTVNFFVFLMVVAAWYAGVFASSISLLGGVAVRPGMAVDATVAVPFELLTKAFVILIALVMCHTAQSWGRRELERFLKVYVASSVIAAALGIFGFATGNEELLWDGRAKGLFDDPNMYAAFLLPGLLSSMYFVAKRRSVIGDRGAGGDPGRGAGRLLARRGGVDPGHRRLLPGVPQPQQPGEGGPLSSWRSRWSGRRWR